MSTPSYAGIGSCHTPAVVLQTMMEIGRQLARRHYTLRSGAAEGADMAFEIGAHLGDGVCETYLPWPGYNEHISLLHTPTPQATAIAQALTPALHELGQSALKLHARSVQEVLGASLDSPVDFVICWTRDGQPKGSTLTAVKLAQFNRVPVFNLGDPLLAGQSADEIVARAMAATNRDHTADAPANEPSAKSAAADA